MLLEYEPIEELSAELQEGELTVVHFIVIPTGCFSFEWWVRVNPQIFIRPHGSEDKLGLVYAHNIPVAPQKYYFKNKKDQLHFTLFFPPLPKGTTQIDIVEKAGGSSNFFNFYNLSLSLINKAPIKLF